MRAVDLAVYADALAGEAAALAARIERARGQLRHAEIEREARAALSRRAVERLEALGYLRLIDDAALRCAVATWSSWLDAVEELQAWVDEQLARAHEASGSVAG